MKDVDKLINATKAAKKASESFRRLEVNFIDFADALKRFSLGRNKDVEDGWLEIYDKEEL